MVAGYETFLYNLYAYSGCNNFTKIACNLKWKIKTHFEDGIEKTIEWYLHNPEILNDMSKTVLDQTPWKNGE